MGTPEVEESEKETKAIFGAIMIENFSKLMSDTKNTDPENSEYSK